MSTLQRDAPSTFRPRLLHWLLPPPLAYHRPRPLHRRERSTVSVECPLHRQHYCRTTTNTTRQAVSPFSSSAKKCVSLATRHGSILYSFARRGMHSCPFFFLPTYPRLSFFRPLHFLHPVFIPLSSSYPNALSISSFSPHSPTLPPFFSSLFLLFRIRGGYRVVTNLLYEPPDVREFDYVFDKRRQKSCPICISFSLFKPAFKK